MQQLEVDSLRPPRAPCNKGVPGLSNLSQSFKLWAMPQNVTSTRDNVLPAEGACLWDDIRMSLSPDATAQHLIAMAIQSRSLSSHLIKSLNSQAHITWPSQLSAVPIGTFPFIKLEHPPGRPEIMSIGWGKLKRSTSVPTETIKLKHPGRHREPTKATQSSRDTRENGRTPRKVRRHSLAQRNLWRATKAFWRPKYNKSEVWPRRKICCSSTDSWPWHKPLSAMRLWVRNESHIRLVSTRPPYESPPGPDRRETQGDQGSAKRVRTRQDRDATCNMANLVHSVGFIFGCQSTSPANSDS